jgi:hypothetical protein
VPLDVTHTGPVSLTQAQSDAVWEILEANPRVVSLLRGDHPLVTRECQPPTGANRSSLSLAGTTGVVSSFPQGPVLL